MSGWADIAEGLKNWRISHLMGIADLRRRYTRSRVGQFWLTLSTGILITTLGIVWSTLFQMSLEQMLPYIATSLIVWTLISGIITDATTTFTDGGRYFVNQRMSFSTAINGIVYRNILIFLHNAVIIVLVFAVFHRIPGPQALLALPGLCLVVVTGTWLSYVVAIVCTRYRDISQIVLSLLQIAFYVTPVLWKIDFIPAPYRELVAANPFAIYISVVRDPLLGNPVPLEHWIAAITITLTGFMIALPFIGKYRNRIIYWL